MSSYIELKSEFIYFPSSVLIGTDKSSPSSRKKPLRFGEIGGIPQRPLHPHVSPAVLLSFESLSQNLLAIQALALMLPVQGISKDKEKAGKVWVTEGGGRVAVGGSPTLLNSYCQLRDTSFGPIRHSQIPADNPVRPHLPFQTSTKQPSSLEIYHLKRLPEPQPQA